MGKALRNIAPLFLLMAVLVSGCGYKYYLQSGKEDYNNLMYVKAKDKFNKAIEKRPESYESLRMLALTLQKMKDFEGAEQAYRLAMNYPQVTLDDKFNYALMLMNNDRHDRAELIFREYLSERPEDKVAKAMLESCQFIELFKEDTALYRIDALPLLSNVSMYSPVIYQGGLAYTAERLVTGKANPWTGNSFNDIYFSKSEGGQWMDQKPVSEVFNGKYNDGPIAFDEDMDFAVFTRSYTDSKGNRRKTDADNFNNLFLYQAERGMDEFQRVDTGWQNVQELPFNSVDYSCIHPTLTKGGDTLYFASDMEGGLGGYDIYMSTRTNGSWSDPMNLGEPVNTTANEVFPVLGNDGALFFSSNGHPTLGALDIFKTVWVSDSWRKPRNMNYPINSTSDDFSMVFDAGDSVGYFSSNRQGVDRIYAFKKRPSGIVFINGLVQDEEGNHMSGAMVSLIDMQTGDTLKTVTTSEDGKFDFELQADRQYKIASSKDGYFTESYERSTVDQYQDEEEDLTFTMRELIVTDPEGEYKGKGGEGVYEIDNIYYDYNMYNIRSDAARELDKLVNTMKDNPTISIELHSHTDARGADDYNKNLSDKRAKSAKSYLVQRGVAASRIGTKGYGEERIANRCKNDVECSEEEHQENRRTEFIVTAK